MIKRIFRSSEYHASEFLFDRLAIPQIKSERISKALIRKYLPSKPVIIDCGAHEGHDSLQLARHFPGGVVHAFEPVPELYERLKERKLKKKNIFTYQLALADRTGTLQFYVSEGQSDGSSSLLVPKTHLTDHPLTVFKKKISINAVTLDGWARENKISKVDLLWLDMQGFEMQMLQASNEILPTVKVIHTEVSVRDTYEGVVQYQDYRRFLENKGFSVVAEAIPDGWDMGNVLFVKK